MDISEPGQAISASLWGAASEGTGSLLLEQPVVRARGFEVGRDVYVAFSPEHIDPGDHRIALVNELADVSRSLDLDVIEVVEAAASKPYGFMPFYPGPGVGGHCIPCDPHCDDTSGGDDD